MSQSIMDRQIGALYLGTADNLTAVLFAMALI
jgi:hypothetical protein